jgi:four helix bundle protein
MHKFKELKVWQKAVDLATLTYQITKSFPGEERYGLTAQINRSVISIASNVAEGAGRNSKKEFVNFLSIAAGSSYELETQLLIACNLKYLSKENLDRLAFTIEEVQKMIYALQNLCPTDLTRLISILNTHYPILFYGNRST